MRPPLGGGSALTAATLQWYEVADSHPAARTTMIRRLDSPDPGRAAAAALDRSLKLEPLCPTVHDRFVLAGGWRAWRVSTPEKLSGRWVYIRPVDVEQSDAWPPRTWQDCVVRYESRAADSADGGEPPEGSRDADSAPDSLTWESRLQRDRAVVSEMLQAMGTDSPMNPFCLVNHSISRGVLKATIEDMRVTYSTSGPGTRFAPRALCTLLTRIGIRRATDHLVEPHFLDRAEPWLHEQHQARVRLEEADRLERRLLQMMRDGDFVWLARCCAIAAMCELDPKAAALWYRTGGDSSGHPDVRAYAALAREHLPPPARPPRRRRAPASRRRAAAGRTAAGREPGRLVRCGAVTLTGAVCRHKVSASTSSCPAGHTRAAHDG